MLLAIIHFFEYPHDVPGLLHRCYSSLLLPNVCQSVNTNILLYQSQQL